VRSSNFIRWCGLAAIVGGVVYASLGLLIGPLVRYLYFPSGLWDLPPVLRYSESISLFLLLLGAMAAIAGLHTLQRERYGLVGALASLIAFVSVAIILVGGLVDILAGQRYPGVASILIVAVLVATIGLVALGTATIAARVLPWWCGASTILGSPPFVFFFASLYEVLSLLVGVAWALVGYALLRQAGVRQAQQPSCVR
jgi:chromate transport protein ChrA